MKVLVVSPHPDDETLGAGGTILRLARMGIQIYWLNITDVQGNPNYSIDFQKNRVKQIKKIKDFYGFADSFNLKMPTTKLDSYDTSQAIQEISCIFKQITPEVLILPDYNDAHSDHRKVFDWCYSCSKIFRYPYIKQILTMEILSETDFGHPQSPFVPNYYVDISNEIERKIEASKIYNTEIGEIPFPRSIDRIYAQALFRGGQAGVKYAEAFRLIKKIF